MASMDWLEWEKNSSYWLYSERQHKRTIVRKLINLNRKESQWTRQLEMEVKWTGYGGKNY